MLPSSVSAPARPYRTFAPLLPISMLAVALPVPLMAAEPVNVRFSMPTASVNVTLDCTRSTPPEALLSLSYAESDTLSTT